MITVHHLNNSRSQRVLWLLEELGLPYQVKRYERDPRTMLAPRELLQVHPLGKSPIITDGDITLAESGAIVEYLVERYGQGRLKPASGTPHALQYLYWMHFAEGSAMPPLLLSLIFSTIERKAPWLVRPVARAIAKQVRSGFIRPNLDKQLAYMNDQLAATGWFAGQDFTAADVQMSFPVEAANSRAGFGSKYPNLSAYLNRILERPAYQRALEKGGPYAIV